MKSLKRISASIFTVLLLLCLTSSASAWIIVLNGTSSAGKSTLAKNLQKITKQSTEILSIDTEMRQIFTENLESMGYHYDGKTTLDDWADTLPKEVTKKICDDEEDEVFDAACKRMLEKARKFDQAGTNVIIDTVLFDEAWYKLLANGLHSDHTYFFLVYASITQLFKNLVARNSSGNKSEEREPLQPFGQFFSYLFKPCKTTSLEKLDVLTKKDFENVREKFEKLIESNDQDNWKKVKSIIDKEFFFDDEAVIGIASKLPHDFVINTGTVGPDECAKKLDEWLTGKIK